jgi:hypothetical protein
VLSRHEALIKKMATGNSILATAQADRRKPRTSEAELLAAKLVLPLVEGCDRQPEHIGY